MLPEEPREQVILDVGNEIIELIVDNNITTAELALLLFNLKRSYIQTAEEMLDAD